MSAPQSPYGNAGDALDFALDHIADPFERTDFLECWRQDDVREWPEYFDWLHLQRTSAALRMARGESA